MGKIKQACPGNLYLSKILFEISIASPIPKFVPDGEAREIVPLSAKMSYL